MRIIPSDLRAVFPFIKDPFSGCDGIKIVVKSFRFRNLLFINTFGLRQVENIVVTRKWRFFKLAVFIFRLEYLPEDHHRCFLSFSDIATQCSCLVKCQVKRRCERHAKKHPEIDTGIGAVGGHVTRHSVFGSPGNLPRNDPCFQPVNNLLGNHFIKIQFIHLFCRLPCGLIWASGAPLIIFGHT